MASHRFWRSPANESRRLYWVVAVMSLVLLALTAARLWIRPDEGFSRSRDFAVLDLDPFGPAAKAGLHIGDIIIEHDHKPIATASYLYVDKRPGDSVHLSILRGDRLLNLDVILQPPSPMLLLSRLDPLLVALSFWACSTFILFCRTSDPTAYLFLCFCQTGATALVIGTLSTYNVRWAIWLFNSLLSLSAVLLLRFHLVFPVLSFRAVHKSISYILYGMGGILISLLSFLLALDLRTSNWYRLGQNGVRAFFSLSVLACIGLLLHTYRATTHLQVRRQVRLIVLGTTVAFLPLLGLSILPELLIGSPIVSYEVTFLSLSLIPVSYLVATFKYNLFNIDQFLNKGLVYLALGSTWTSVYLFLVVALQRILTDTLSSHVLSSVLIIALMVAASAPVKRWFQRQVDRIFDNENNYYAVIVGMSSILSTIYHKEELADLLVYRLTEMMNLSGAALFWPEESDLVLLRSTSLACKEHEKQLPIDGKLVCLLRTKREPTEAAAVRRWLRHEGLSKQEQTWLEMPGIDFWVPLMFRTELQGVLALGSKRVGDLFTSQDRQVLRTLADQAALAGKTAQLLAEQQRRRAELEAAHRQILVSREDERKQIARDLHDQTLQSLIALSIDIGTVIDESNSRVLTTRMERIESRIYQLIRETRAFCSELRPPELSMLGLAEAIYAYTHEQAKQWKDVVVVRDSSRAWGEKMVPNLIIELHLSWEENRLSDSIATALFRVYQEALTNVYKHAAARHVCVQMHYNEEEVSLSLVDDGCGFTLPHYLDVFAEEGHFGLLGIKEWVSAIEGNLRITSQPGAGTEIFVSAPTRSDGQRTKQEL